AHGSRRSHTLVVGCFHRTPPRHWEERRCIFLLPHRNLRPEPLRQHSQKHNPPSESETDIPRDDAQAAPDANHPLSTQTEHPPSPPADVFLSPLLRTASSGFCIYPRDPAPPPQRFLSQPGSRSGIPSGEDSLLP